MCEHLTATLEEFQMPYYDYTKRVYIDSVFIDEGTIVIRAIGDTTYLHDVVSPITDLTVSVQTCSFPREVSFELYNIIKEKFMSEKYNKLKKEIGWTKLDYNPLNNMIIVGLEACDTTQIHLFKDKIANSPVIAFQEWGMGTFDR